MESPRWDIEDERVDPSIVKIDNGIILAESADDTPPPLSQAKAFASRVARPEAIETGLAVVEGSGGKRTPSTLSDDADDVGVESGVELGVELGASEVESWLLLLLPFVFGVDVVDEPPPLPPSEVELAALPVAATCRLYSGIMPFGISSASICANPRSMMTIKNSLDT